VQKNFETFGNYILLEKLAAGGMAEVYLAKKIAASGVQKFVAIKRILQQYSDSKDFIAMFKDEAKIAINLSHSNVVSIYDFGVESSQFYIVMEFVEGRNLRQILNRMKKTEVQFSIGQVAHIIKQVAAGLDHAHRCIDPTTGQPLNIIHRDMSPQNVMLGFEGDAKVVDFGIAKAAHQIEATRAGTLKGKFGYMSPEQVEGQSVDARTDIFALGIMAWEMLANQRLFLANSEMQTLRKIRECDIPSLRKINPNIPSELDQIIQKTLEKDKLERYQSAADLHRDLQGFLSRYEPDFSSQDLSQFVKGLFSEEIIQIRKKQIIYSQINIDTKIVENTDVLGQKTIISDDVSMDNISFSELSEHRSKGGVFSAPMKKTANGIDFSTAEFEDGQSKAHKLHIAKRSAHNKSKEYRKNTFTDTQNTLGNIKKRNKNATLLTVIFSMSFLLIFFAYLNKFHPNFKSKFCKSMESYHFCPRSIYIPTNLLSIKSMPDGADIYINDEIFSASPSELLINKLPLKITLKKDGYKTITRNIDSIPKDNELQFQMISVPTGFLLIKSVGVQIFIDGIEVKNGQKVSVPASKNIPVRILNPFSGQSIEEVHSVEPNQIKSIILSLPSK
jgi:serine/threonine protein kinase